MEKCAWLFVCVGGGIFFFWGGGCCQWHGGVEEYDEANNALWLLITCV